MKRLLLCLLLIPTVALAQQTGVRPGQISSIPMDKQLWVDATYGNNTTGARGNFVRPYLTLAAALAAASSGDVVYVSPGTYAQSTTPLVIPAGVTMIGSGVDVTTITGDIAKSSNHALVEPSNGSAIYGLTIQNTNAAGVGIGALSASPGFTSAYMEGIKVIATADGIIMGKAATTGLVVADSVISTQGTGLNTANTPTASLHRCDIITDGTTSGTVTGLYIDGGTVVFGNGSIRAVNGTTSNIAARSSGASTILTVYDTSIDRNATGSINYDLQQLTSGTLRVGNVFRVDGSAFNNTGTITEISPYITTIPNGSLTYAKLQNTSAQKVLLGRGAGVAGPVVEITMGSKMDMIGDTLMPKVSTDFLFTAPQTITLSDASTGVPSTLLALTHNTSASPGNGFGTEILFKGQSESAPDRNMGHIQTVWTDSTDATRSASMLFQLVNAGTNATKLWLYPSGGLSLINVDGGAGFFNTSSGGGYKINNIDITSATQTLTNKRINPRVHTIATANPWTPASDTYDEEVLTALQSECTVNAPSGTPVVGQKLILRVTTDNSSRGFTWTTGSAGAFREIVALPTTLAANKTMYVGCIYNASASRWDVVAVSVEP